jgi:hypothetical protein
MTEELKDLSDLNLRTTVGKTTPKEIWETKDVWFNQAQKSREAWKQMSDDQRQSVENLVRGALERMYDRTSEWIPDALTVEGGNFLDVQMRFLFTDIDKEIDRNDQATSFQIKAATDASRQALEEFSTE